MNTTNIQWQNYPILEGLIDKDYLILLSKNTELMTIVPPTMNKKEKS